MNHLFPLESGAAVNDRRKPIAGRRREKCGSGTCSVFEQELVRLGIPIERTLELPSNEAMRAAVEAGAGATAISRVAVRSALLLKSMHAVRFVPLERPFVLLKHRDCSQSSAVRALLTIIQNYEQKPA